MKDILNAVYSFTQSVGFNRFLVNLIKVVKALAHVFTTLIIAVITFRVMQDQIDGATLLIALGWSLAVLLSYGWMERMAQDDLSHAISRAAKISKNENKSL
jgi:hypothetical protein